MSFDQLINFGKVQVSIGYDASATSIALSAGDGAKLPSTFNYNVVWWNFTDYADPADALHAGEAEIVRVTNRSTDTLTITRAQEGTSAVTHNTSAKTYKMALALTKKMIDDITIAATDTVQTTDATQTTLDSFALTDENTYHVEALVTAVQSTGAERASYHIACTVYRTGAGSATLQGAVTVVHANESDANLDCTFTVNSNDLRLSVTGIAAETWEWDGRLTRINGSNA
jgi:hypothetical protein